MSRLRMSIDEFCSQILFFARAKANPVQALLREQCETTSGVFNVQHGQPVTHQIDRTLELQAFSFLF